MTGPQLPHPIHTLRLLVLAVLLAVGSACGAGSQGGDASRPFVVRTRPAPSPLHGEGPLVFRAGFELSTRHLPFGGFSGLVIEGDRLLAVSDWGYVWQSRLVTAPNGDLRGFTDSRLGALHDPDGVAATPKLRYDAEELLAWEGGWLISFEGDHRLFHYRRRVPFALSDPTPRPLLLPEEASSLHRNGGFEAMARLRDGRLLVIAEDVPEIADGDATAEPAGPALLPAWLGRPPSTSAGPDDGEPILTRWQPLWIEQSGSLHPTGATILPSGDVLLLERSWNEEDGVRARFSILPEAEIQAQARLTPRPLWRLEDPSLIDNFEAVYAEQGADGATLIYVLSDDNFSEDQRTLLFQLELRPNDSVDPPPASPDPERTTTSSDE